MFKKVKDKIESFWDMQRKTVENVTKQNPINGKLMARIKTQTYLNNNNKKLEWSPVSQKDGNCRCKGMSHRGWIVKPNVDIVEFQKKRRETKKREI